jgi:site-specific recombinase XerC
VIVDGLDYLEGGPASIRHEERIRALQAQLRERLDDEGWRIFLRLDEAYYDQIIDTRMEERAATLARVLGHQEFTSELLAAFGALGEPTADLSRIRPEPVAPVLTLVKDTPVSEGVSDDELIELYAKYQRDRNLADKTVENTSRILHVFLRHNPQGFAQVTEEDAERTLDARKALAKKSGRDFGPRSRQLWLSMVGTFYVWAIRHGHLETNPANLIDRPKLRRALPRPMVETDLSRAIDVATPDMKAILHLGAGAGLRCAEIAGLRVDDIDFEAATIRVVHGKGDKERMVPLHPYVADALRSMPMPESGPVFRSRRDLRPYTPAYLSIVINRHLQAVGVKSTAHSLRHSYATEVYRVTGDLRLTQELMGHESPTTTAIYTKADMSKAGAAVGRLNIGRDRGPAKNESEASDETPEA